MKRVATTVAWFVFLLGAAFGQELFPERAAADRQAEVFFDQVRLDSPAVRLLEKLVAGKNYLTAFLNLSEALMRDPFVTRLCTGLDRDHYEMTLHFHDLADELTPASRPSVAAEVNADGDLPLALLTIHSLARRYGANELPGVMAMRHWVTLLHMLRQVAGHRHLTASEAGLLELGGRLGFFKKSPQWAKTARRYFRRHPEQRSGLWELGLLAEAGKEI
jgi:hypothetical protein